MRKSLSILDRIKVAIGQKKIIEMLVGMNREQWRSFKRSFIEAERMRYRNASQK